MKHKKEQIDKLEANEHPISCKFYITNGIDDRSLCTKQVKLDSRGLTDIEGMPTL